MMKAHLYPFYFSRAVGFAVLLGVSTSPLSAESDGTNATGTMTQPAMGWFTQPFIKVVANYKSDVDNPIPIFFARDVSAVVSDNAHAQAAGAPASNDPVDPATGGVGLNLAKAKILSAGSPVTLSASPAAANSGFGQFTAASSATVTPNVLLNANGEILSAGATTKTMVDAKEAAPNSFAATGNAFATAAAGTDPFVFSILPSARILQLHVDLNPFYEEDANSRFGMRAFTNDTTNDYGEYNFQYRITTNLTGEENALSLDFHADTAHNQVTVGFTSSIAGIAAAAPITAEDFLSPVPGDYFLSPAKSQFDVEIVVPPGVHGADTGGKVGLILNVDQSAQAFVVSAIPEPSQFGLVFVGIATLCIGRRIFLRNKTRQL